MDGCKSMGKVKKQGDGVIALSKACRKCFQKVITVDDGIIITFQ